MGQSQNMASGVTGAAARIQPALDREVALSRVGGDLELLQEIAQLFLDDSNRMVTEVRRAVQSRDAVALDRAAHTIKGCVSNFGALRLYEAAFALEQMGRKRDLTLMEPGFRVLEMEVARLEADLRALTAEHPPAN